MSFPIVEVRSCSPTVGDIRVMVHLCHADLPSMALSSIPQLPTKYTTSCKLS